MKRIIILLVFGLVVLSLTFGQTERARTTAGEPDPSKVGTDTAQQKLKEVSVTRFETIGYWDAKMAADEGLITLKRFPGGPAAKEPIPDEEKSGIKERDEYVLGAKVEFFKRGHNTFAIFPVKPLPIEGITKTVSIWVAGRNYGHILTLLIEDFFGQRAEIRFSNNGGKLNFSGWKKLTATIPPNIIQSNYHYNNKMGIKIVGFKVYCDPEESYGSYYIYFDDMRAVTDLFAEHNRDEDDMVDTW